MKLKTLLFITGIITIGYFVCYAADKVIYNADTKEVMGTVVKQSPSPVDDSRTDYITDKGKIYGATSKMQLTDKPTNLSMNKLKAYKISDDKTKLVEVTEVEVVKSTGAK